MCVCVCVNKQDLSLAKRKDTSVFTLYETSDFLNLQSNCKFLFFHVSPDTGEPWRRVTQAGAHGLLFTPSGPAFWGLAWCVVAVYTCWSAFCVWVGTASLHDRASNCSWGLSQSFETYELAAGARECLSQFLGELHVFSRRLDHCPQSRLARQNVTVTVGDILNFYRQRRRGKGEKKAKVNSTTWKSTFFYVW